MSGITKLSINENEVKSKLKILDLSFNSLSLNIEHNLATISKFKSLRVLNISGNDLKTLHCSQDVKLNNVELLIAENNNLKSDSFDDILRLAAKVKVLVLDGNKIFEIPKLQASKNQLGNLSILSLAKNPIQDFAAFSNVLQFRNLQVLKLQETPFVLTTSKNPKVVEDSPLIVERHYSKPKHSSKIGPKLKFRKVSNPKRHIKDKTWFYDLIEDLEKRVKYEVRQSILSDSRINSARAEKFTTDDYEPVENPVFLTEVLPEKGSEENDSEVETSESKSIATDISETLTNMSILNDSETSVTGMSPAMKITENVKMLRMALNQQHLIHDKKQPKIIEFPYESKKVKRIETLAIEPIKSANHKILKESLELMKSRKITEEEKLDMKKSIDWELYENLKKEYDELRQQITDTDL